MWSCASTATPVIDPRIQPFGIGFGHIGSTWNAGAAGLPPRCSRAFTSGSNAIWAAPHARRAAHVAPAHLFIARPLERAKYSASVDLGGPMSTRWTSMARNGSLGEFEHLVLLAAFRHPDGAY